MWVLGRFGERLERCELGEEWGFGEVYIYECKDEFFGGGVFGESEAIGDN